MRGVVSRYVMARPLQHEMCSCQGRATASCLFLTSGNESTVTRTDLVAAAHMAANELRKRHGLSGWVYSYSKMNSIGIDVLG